MAQTKKELVRAAFRNEPVDRVPVGFWHHFLKDPVQEDAFAHPELEQKNVEAHLAFAERFRPDFIKIMTDGFFKYPLHEDLTAEKALRLKPLGPESDWVQRQVGFAGKLAEHLGKEVFLFYNLFSAPRVLGFTLDKNRPNEVFDRLFREDRKALRHVLDVLFEDIALLAGRVVRDGHADGIYFSVQNVPLPEVTREVYEELIAPGEKKVIAAAGAAGGSSILHICGYEGVRNDLSWYEEYDIPVINFAAAVEHVTLGKAKKLFAGKTVLGGFDNTDQGVLYRGDREAVRKETAAILEESGRTGVILGADCTVPPDISVDHLNWVREKAAE